MAMRIRYKNTRTEGVLRSVQRFRGNQGALYEVDIDTNSMTYKVRNISNGNLVRSTEKDGRKVPTNLEVLKKQAKKALESMGVNFNVEVRNI